MYKHWKHEEDDILLDLLSKADFKKVPHEETIEASKRLGKTPIAVEVRLSKLRSILGKRYKGSTRTPLPRHVAMREDVLAMERVTQDDIRRFSDKYGVTFGSAKGIMYRILRKSKGPATVKQDPSPSLKTVGPYADFYRGLWDDFYVVLKDRLATMLTEKCAKCRFKDVYAENDTLRAENMELRRVNNEQRDLLVELKELREAAYRFGKRGERVVNIT